MLSSIFGKHGTQEAFSNDEAELLKSVSVRKCEFFEWLQRIGQRQPRFWFGEIEIPKSVTEAVGKVGAGSQDGTESASVKPDGKNQKRLKLLNEWYAVLCSEHENNRELIIEAINRLTNDEIKEELKNITPSDEKYLWASGADRWIMDNGKNVWLFKRTQCGKSKKSK